MELHLHPAQVIEELKETWKEREEPQAAGQRGKTLLSDRRELQWHPALCQPAYFPQVSQKDVCLQ